jgi:hypothetical protein
MRDIAYRARRVAAGCAVVAVVFTLGCDFKDRLLEPQNPGLIDESAVNSPAAALALKVGAVGRVKNLVNCGGGECLWEEGGHLADEFKNSDFQPTRQDVDQRTITTSNGTLSYTNVTTIRGYVITAIRKMGEFLPTNTADIGELYMLLGFVEMSMGETYCNGIPLGRTIDGVVDYAHESYKPLTNQQVYDAALAHVDSGLAILGAGTDPATVEVRRAALIVKARILVNKGQFANAAALVPDATIPSSPGASSYQYMWTTSTASNGDDNGIWSVNNSVARITVADSFDIINGQYNQIKNAIPFATLNDPRAPVIRSTTSPAEDGTTPLFIQQIWKSRDDPIPMVSAIDARLIEAEAKLSANDIAGMMNILNKLRSDRPRIGTYNMPANAVLAPLPTPATKEDAISLFFREKALWTFGRGQRLGDMRRLIRQYGRTEDKVFPVGNYLKGGVYGHDVNFPVPDGELVNPQFKGCLDRNA